MLQEKASASGCMDSVSDSGKQVRETEKRHAGMRSSSHDLKDIDFRVFDASG